MRSFLGRIRQFFTRDDGPTAVEYAIMMSLIVVVCVAALTTLGGRERRTFRQVNKAISGRAR